MSPSLDSRENREFASELKFLVEPRIAERIRGWARARLLCDPNAAGPSGDDYLITSLYFDTDRFDVFHRRGSYGRSKYRIRRYGQGDTAFLERKLKTRGLLAKRRSPIPLDALDRLGEPDPVAGWAGYWFHRRIMARELGPVCQVSYHRTARVAVTARGLIRLTLDEDLRAQRAAGLWFSDAPGEPILDNRVVLELKFRSDMPVLFKQLVEEFALDVQPFSKYRLAATALGLAPATAALVTRTPGHPYV
jgi:hypothetical protein